MSTALTKSNVDSVIQSYESDFNNVNAYNTNFKKEALFACQILTANTYLRDVAIANPDSLKAAVLNIAAIGISLNPALKEAYLVPRGKLVCLDISYIGLVKLATDSGSVVWVQSEIIKKNDDFKYLGLGKLPHHEMDPFGDRGEVIGVYCAAKLSSGEYLVTIMSKAECDEIRDKSSQSAKKGPWVEFYEEMLKKTVIKRASKLWPKSKRIQEAVDIINLHEGIDFTTKTQGPYVNTETSPENEPSEFVFKNIRDLLKAKNKTEAGLIEYINTQFSGTNLEKLEDMDAAHIKYTYQILGAKK